MGVPFMSYCLLSYVSHLVFTAISSQSNMRHVDETGGDDAAET